MEEGKSPTEARPVSPGRPSRDLDVELLFGFSVLS